jgi:parvulin-like peptidyl-prolyl isomerase
MDKKLNLTLPERHSSDAKPLKVIIWLLCASLMASVLGVLLILYGQPNSTFRAASSALLSPDKIKELALRMEKQELTSSAVDTWKEYMTTAVLDDEEQAKIWYRIGKLLQNEGDYKQALAAYYRSESLANVKELSLEINRRVQESLESLGKFSALRYELEERTSIGDRNKALTGEEVLVEIGGHKITQRELDSRIEQLIERQLAPLATLMSEKDLQSQKQTLFKKFSSSPERQQILNQIVVEELLFRKAVEDNVKEQPEVRMILQQAERSVLAQQVLAQEEAAQIKITENDLKTYYQAHQQEYVEPEQARISHILVKDEATAEEVIDKLDKGESFANLARQYSLDEATRQKAGEIDAWTKPGVLVTGIGQAEDINRAIFAADTGTVLDKNMASVRGIHVIKVLEKKEKQQKDFAAVQAEVYSALRSQKEEEVRQALFESLQNKYDVVIHTSKFQNEKDGSAVDSNQ